MRILLSYHTRTNTSIWFSLSQIPVPNAVFSAIGPGAVPMPERNDFQRRTLCNYCTVSLSDTGQTYLYVLDESLFVYQMYPCSVYV